ncbi:MAG: DUF4097 family beta strand repeat protein [Lachnospiraceae bacterium]|nr:DUF4097 family beta strand repeat protein [Lachnospiraceae bacterium]
METIKVYLDNMFMNLPREPKVLKAREELEAMMEDKYNEMIAEGKGEHEALGAVISEFGDMKEITQALGVEPVREHADNGARQFQDDMNRFGERLYEDMTTFGADLGTEMAGFAEGIGTAVRDVLGRVRDVAAEHMGEGSRTSPDATVVVDVDVNDGTVRQEVPLREEEPVSRQWKEVRDLAAFSALDIHAKIADVTVEEGEAFRLYLTENLEPELIQDTDGTLHVRENTERAWFSRGGVGSVFFGFGKAGKIRITLPASQQLTQCTMNVNLGNVAIEGVAATKWDVRASAGNLRAGRLHTDTFEARCGAGNIKMDDCSTKQLTCTSTAGNIRLRGVRATQTKLDSGAGNIRLEHGEAGQLESYTSAGNVRVDDVQAENYRLTSSVGNIKVTLPGNRDAYTYHLTSTHGDVRLAGEKQGKRYRTEEEAGKARVEITSNIGDVKIEWKS